MTDHTPANTRGKAPADVNPRGLVFYTCPECGVTLEVFTGFTIICKGSTESPKHAMTI